MRPKALTTHGFAVALGLLLALCGGGAAQAAPRQLPVQLAIGSPLPNSLVGGAITVSVAFNAGMNKIAAFTIYIDDEIYTSRNFLGMQTRGVHDLDLDTTNLANGAHTVRIVAVGARGVILGEDSVTINVRNVGAGGPDVVPPLVHFRGLLDGDQVSGKINVDVLAEDNVSGRDVLVSIFVNRLPALIRNIPPYTLELDTARYLDPNTGTGTIRLEAMAFDRAGNQGKARPLTLKVVPAGPGNATPARPDPTLPASPDTARPMPAAPPAAIAPPMEAVGTLEGDLAAPRAAQPPTPSRPAAQPVPGAKGSAQAAPRVLAKNTVPPAAPRAVAAPAPVSRPGELVIPVPAPMPSLGAPRGGMGVERGGAAGPTAATPAATAPAGSAAEPTSAIPTVPPPGRAPRTTAAQPRLNARIGTGTLTPSRAGTDRPGEAGEVVVLVPTGQPAANGRLPMEVFTLNPSAPGLPREREYRVQSGDTVGGLARKFRVTEKSILVANGITSPQALRTGSRIRIPGTFDVVMNDRRIAFDVAPRVENGLPLAPFRQIFEHAGGVVVWYPDSREVRAASSTTEVKLKIGEREASVNQVIVVMDREAFIDAGRTIVPITFMEKALDLKAEYDVRSGTIVLAPK